MVVVVVWLWGDAKGCSFDCICCNVLHAVMTTLHTLTQELARYGHVDIIVRPHRMVYWSWFEVCFNDRMFEHWLKDADILKVCLLVSMMLLYVEMGVGVC